MDIVFFRIIGSVWNLFRYCCSTTYKRTLGGDFGTYRENSLYYYGVNVLTLKIVGILTFGLLNDGGSECVVLMKCLVKVVLAIGISSMFLPGFNMARNFLLDIIKKMEKRSKIK